MAFIRYTLYFGNPPILSEPEEIEAGREIVATGGPAEWKKKAPYLPLNERLRAERAATSAPTPAKLALSAAALLVSLVLIAVAGPALWVPMGILSVTVLPLSLYTIFTSRRRYHTWVDKVVQAYNAEISRKTDPAKPAITNDEPRKIVTFPGGSIKFRNGEPAVVTLGDDQNAATMIFAQGHDMLEQFRRDAAHPLIRSRPRKFATTGLQ